MRERPRLVISNQAKKKRQSPWQAEALPWINKPILKQRQRWMRLGGKFALASFVISATVLGGTFGSHFDMNSKSESASLLTKQFLSKNSLYVVDGDTIHYNGEKIRIANIDTPEISGARCDSELKRGLEAKAALKQLIDGRQLVIKRGDPDTGRMVDQYGRTLALVSTGGRDLGTMLIQQQHARPWTGRRMPWC